jgi:hypothetical protein
MAIFNKQFEHRGYKFITTVELNTTSDRRLIGKFRHTVKTNCLGSNNYYETADLVSPLELKFRIESQQQTAMEYVDTLLQKTESFEEMLLDSLGFTQD